MASRSRKTEAEQADENTAAGQDGTAVDNGQAVIGGASTDVSADDSATGEDAVATPNGEFVGNVSADGFAVDVNAPGTDEGGAKDGEPVNEHGQTVEQARREVEVTNDHDRATHMLAAPLEAPSEKAQQTGVVEDPNEGISVPSGLTQSPTTATPVITDGARLLDEDGNEVADPESIFDKPQGPATFVTVNQRVYVEEGLPGSRRTTRRLLFPVGARVHRSTVGTFAAEWADKSAK